MKYACERLQGLVLERTIPVFCPLQEIKFQEWLKYSQRLPRFSIPIYHSIKEIKEQWASLARTIIYKGSQRLRSETLFAMTKGMMENYYNRSMSDVVYLLANWLNEILSYYEDTTKSSSLLSVVGLSVLFAVGIGYFIK